MREEKVLVLDPVMIEHCAPSVAPATLLQVIRTESGGDRYALNVNGLGRFRSSSVLAARRKAEVAIALGYSVDIGLMQINSQHLRRFHLTVAQAFEPCTNLKIGAMLLTASYIDAARIFGPGQGALQHALSAYNTGNFERGLDNGYVAQYYIARRSSARKRGTPSTDEWPLSASTRSPPSIE